MYSETEGPPIPGRDVPENYYDDFEGVKISVPCCTWNEQEALKCWGEDYAKKSAPGVVSKITLHRKTKEPKFEITFI